MSQLPLAALRPKVAILGRASRSALRYTYICSGWLCVALGTIGAFLPIIPTVPFMLLAAYFFSKGSPQLHTWLLSKPHIGPVIKDWEKHKVIGKREKFLGVSGMLALMSYPIFFQSIPRSAKLAIALIGLAVSAFILSRPSRPKSLETSSESS